MDINLYIHSIEIEYLNEKCYVNNNEEQEQNIIYSLNLKVEDNLRENNEKKNFKYFETPWYMCFKNGGHELCMMSYEMNISHAFNLLENNERLILYLLRKNIKNDKIEYLHRNELNIRDKEYYDSNNYVTFENDKVKGKIKLYFKNGIIYNNLLHKIKPDEFLKKDRLPNFLIESEELVKNKHKDEVMDSMLQSKCISNDFDELINSRRTLYWVYLDDDNNEQGPFNSNTIFNWIISEYFEDNTLIRLHDKKKFYKLYEVIEYIEKNVLMNMQNSQLDNQLSGQLENKFSDNMSKKNEEQVFHKLKEGEKMNDSKDISKKEHIKENEINYYLKNKNKEEYKDEYNVEQINKKERNEEIMRNNIIYENLADHINKKNQEEEDMSENKRNTRHNYGGMNNIYNRKLKIENDICDSECNKDFWKVDTKNKEFTKNYKNAKKKNEVKRLKKEIKKIKEEMIKLKEKNYKEKHVIDSSEKKLDYDSNKGMDEKEENTFLKQNDDIIQNGLHPSTINNLMSNIKEGNINNENIHENNNFNNDFNNNTLDMMKQNKTTESVNYLNSIFKKDMDKELNSSNNVKEELTMNENEEKKKYIEIALSSINQAQECLLNIKKKRITSYLNKIINLSNYDKSTYLSNDESKFGDIIHVDLKKNDGKNSYIKNGKYAHYFDSYKPIPVVNDMNKKYTCIESKKKKDEIYLIPEEKYFKKIVTDTPQKETKEDYLLTISKNKMVLKNFKLTDNAKESNIKKKKREEITKLCFNIVSNNSKIIYNYNLNYDKFLKYVIFIQYNIKKWLRKKRIYNDLLCYHYYYDTFNFNKLSNKKKSESIYNDFITQKIEEEKIKEVSNMKTRYNLRKYFSNDKNDHLYDAYDFILEKRKIKENDKSNLRDISVVYNIDKEKDLCINKLKNGEYFIKKLNKCNKDEIAERYNKNNIYDLFDKFPINNPKCMNSKTSLKKNNIERVNENYHLKNDYIQIKKDQLNINEDYNLHDYFSDVLSKYKNFNSVKSVNDSFENFNKDEPLVENSNKCSNLKSIDNNMNNKKDILLKIINNLKFDNILNEKKQKCKLQINFKDNSISSMNPFIDNYIDIHLNKCNIDNRKKYNQFIESNNINNNLYWYNSRLIPIKLQDNDTSFCKNAAKKKFLINNTHRNESNMFLFHNIEDSYIKNTIKKKCDNYNYADVFLKKLDH